MKQINTGLIGIGKMGILHGGILHSFDEIVPTAVADNQSQLHRFVETLSPGMTLYKDYRQMLDNEPLDLVYITTPTSMHPIIAEECVDRGINFFMEKPLGISTEQCVSLLNKISDMPVINMIGYVYHYHTLFKKGKEIVDSGILGSLINVKSSMYLTQTLSKKAGSKYKKSVHGGGVLNVCATHLVDILMWYFGNIAQVTANVRSYYSHEVEDFAHSYLTFFSGLTGFLDTSWSLRGYRLPEICIEVEGKNGKLVVTDDFVKLFTNEAGQWKIWNKQTLYEGVSIDIGGPEFTREDAQMVIAVTEGKMTDVDVFYAFEVQRVVDAIYRSAETGTRVDVSVIGGYNG